MYYYQIAIIIIVARLYFVWEQNYIVAINFSFINKFGFNFAINDGAFR